MIDHRLSKTLIVLTLTTLAILPAVDAAALQAPAADECPPGPVVPYLICQASHAVTAPGWVDAILEEFVWGPLNESYDEAIWFCEQILGPGNCELSP